jgi:CHAT domain-containing protein/Tfp pilus assembly protein PilF
MLHLSFPFAIFPLFGLLVIATSQESFIYPPNLFQQSTQEQRASGSGTGGENDARALEPGKPHRRELAGGQRHDYRIRLDADQFLKAVVEQEGIDIAMQVVGPDGAQILEVDSEGPPHGQESASQVAEAAGVYRLVVLSKQPGAPAGRYEIRIEELRAATENDRALQEARKLFEGARQMRRAGKYDEAIPLVERALKTREMILGTDHRDVAAALNSLALIYWNKSDYAKAEPLYQRALSIVEKVLRPEHPIVANSLNNLALLYKDKGDYAKAEPLFLRALAIWEKALGPEDPTIAVSMNNLATLYHERGEYAKAEPRYQRALTIWEKAFGPDHPDVALSLFNLGILCGAIGDHAKAEPLFQRALAIWEKTSGPDHPDVSHALNSLGILYRNKGDYAKAEPLHQRALAIRRKAMGPDHPDVANSLHNLGLLYSKRGDDTKAEPLYHQALSIWEKSLGPDHPDVAGSLNNLADIHRDKGAYEKAEPLYQRALAIREKTLGPEHPDVAESLNDIAVFFMAKGDTAQAITFQSRANAIRERNLKLNLAIGSERQKLVHLDTLSKQTDQTVTLHLSFAPRDLVACSMAVNLILQRKGRALDAASESLNALRSRFNEEDRALLDRLTDTRSQIARLVLDGLRRMTATQYRDRIKTLEEQAESLEAEISRRSDEFLAQSLPITLEAVRAAIPDDAALIEFASYRPFDPKASEEDDAYGRPRYVAYILRRQGEIQWKELGDAKTIDQAVARLRKAMRAPKRRDMKNLARAVDRKVFQPLRPLVGNLARLLISPEGELNLIPFAALVDERWRYRVERYSISYLASGRDLLRLGAPRKSQSGPLIIADPDFGGRREVEAARLLKQTKAAPKKQAGKESPAPAFSQYYFPALPYTAEEGEALRRMLPGATLLTKRQASKAALMQAHSPELLHIATHGFFLEDLKLTSTGKREKSAHDASRRLKQVRKDDLLIEYPLLRAGLALAGANEQKDGDNGILTALEMTGLNLWGTKLVALSACDTGVGEVRNGDGVHGLRRALALAGTETQVMSLWPVSDRWTRELMVAYYRRLKAGEGRSEALRQAQLEMLKNVKRRSPYYWAGFILSGEWANLEGRRSNQYRER